MIPKNASKAQASLEALLSLAVLLSAFALLIASAQGLGARLHSSSQASSEQYLLAHEALSIDAAASLSGATAIRAFHGVPSESGNSLLSRHANVSQPVFHKISTDSSGNFYALHECCEPV